MTTPAPSKSSWNAAILLLCSCMFASGGCGIILEYIQATLASMILGNSFEQWAFVIGLMLFWMGAGSLLQVHIPKNTLIFSFMGIETALALLGGFSPVLTYLAYATTDHYVLVLYAFVSLIGILIGLEIPVIIRINNDYAKQLSTNVGGILSADYVGSLAGSLIYVYFLLKYFPITQAAFLMAGVNFFLALVTFVYFGTKGLIHRKVLPSLLMLVTGVFLGFGYFKSPQWQISLEQPLYDAPVVLSKTTAYQHIVITHSRMQNETRLFLNGNLQLCSLDENRYHETLVHPAMNLVSNPKNILILGGGDGCALREVLKYKGVEKILLVDLDPDMISLASTNPFLTRINQDAFSHGKVIFQTGNGVTQGAPKTIYVNQKKISETSPALPVAEVNVMNIDADKFLSQSSDFFDVIIVDLPDPSTPELCKLYSRQFYAKLGARLSFSGAMVVQATSPYFARESFLCIGRTIKSAGFHAIPFHENVPSFGDWGFFIGIHGNRKKSKIMEEISKIRFPVLTSFITPEKFASQLIFGKTMLEARNTEVNTLLRPVLLNLYLNESWKY